jgi:HEPN domain-containing protein
LVTRRQGCALCGAEVDADSSYTLAPSRLVCFACIDRCRRIGLAWADQDAWGLWVEQSEESLEVAREMMTAGRHHLVLFFAHASAECALKALLLRYGRTDGVMGTQSVHALARRVNAVDSSEPQLDPAISRLDLYFNATRYPVGETPKLPRDFFNDPDAAGEAIKLAADMLAEVRRRAQSLA